MAYWLQIIVLRRPPTTLDFSEHNAYLDHGPCWRTLKKRKKANKRKDTFRQRRVSDRKYGLPASVGSSRGRRGTPILWKCDTSWLEPIGSRISSTTVGASSRSSERVDQLITIPWNRIGSRRRVADRLCAGGNPDRPQAIGAQESIGGSGTRADDIRSRAETRRSRRYPPASQPCAYGKTGALSWARWLGSPGVER